MFILCFVMRRRHPRSTRTAPLFPDTTLFRSDRHGDALDQMLFDAVGEGAATKARNAQGREVDAWPRGAPLDRHRNLTGIGIGELVKSECRLQADHAMRDGDRKSTRLNSSH